MSNTNILRELQEENKRLRDELARYKPDIDAAPEWAKYMTVVYDYHEVKPGTGEYIPNRHRARGGFLTVKLNGGSDE